MLVLLLLVELVLLPPLVARVAMPVPVRICAVVAERPSTVVGSKTSRSCY